MRPDQRWLVRHFILITRLDCLMTATSLQRKTLIFSDKTTVLCPIHWPPQRYFSFAIETEPRAATILGTSALTVSIVLVLIRWLQ